MPHYPGHSPRPSWLGLAEVTPRDEWGRITGRQQPFWETRAPMQELGRRMQARYMLGAPSMLEATGWEEDYTPGLEDYAAPWMSGVGPGGVTPSWRAPTYQDLLARAQAAAQATESDLATYTGGLEAPDAGTAEWRRRAWLGGHFNPQGAGSDAEAAQNQLAVATMLAQQRQGGGVYGGTMGRHIATALARQAQQQVDLGRPRASFLGWYLDQMPKTGGTGGAANDADYPPFDPSIDPDDYGTLEYLKQLKDLGIAQA
jgi:hypothetical protein